MKRAPQPTLKEVQVLGPHGFRRLAYAQWGPEKAEQTVVCVHGISRNGRDFDVLAADLAAHGLRVVAPDLPGRGRSDWLGGPAEYTDRAYVESMAALIARLDVPQLDWVGSSLGGHIGMMVAAERGSPLRRLVLNDFGARLSAQALRRIGSYLMKDWRFASLEEGQAHLRELHAPFGRLSDAQWQHLAEHSLRSDGRGGWRFHFDPAFGRRFAVPIMFDVVLWALWDAIDREVLILRGEHSDLLEAATVQEMLRRGAAAAAGRVQAVELRDCGHAPALMDPHQIALVRRFLMGEGAGGAAPTEAPPPRAAQKAPRQKKGVTTP